MRPVADRREISSQDPPDARVPTPFELVTTRVGPFGDRGTQTHAGAVVAGGELFLRAEHPAADRSQLRGRELDEHLAHGLRAIEADGLRHVERVVAEVDLAGGLRQLTGDDAHQRGLADAVVAHEPDVFTRPDAEADVEEELSAVRVRVGKIRDAERHESD